MQNCRKVPRNYIALGEVPKRPSEYYTVITKFYLFRPNLFDYKSGNPLIFVLIIALYFLEDFHYRRGKHVRLFTNWNLPFLKYHWNYLIPLEKRKVVPSMLSRTRVSGFLSPFINSTWRASFESGSCASRFTTFPRVPVQLHVGHYPWLTHPFNFTMKLIKTTLCFSSEQYI